MPLDLKPKLVGLAAKKAALEEQNKLAARDNPNVIVNRDPLSCEHRIGIVFDDSGSMSQQMNNVHAGVEEFLRSCKPNITSVAIYPMNASKYELTTDLPALAMLVKNIKATDSTPLCETAIKLSTVNITRMIVFSDGVPDYDDRLEYYRVVNIALEKKIPVDTVYLGRGNDAGYEFMKKLASDTGGIFLHFDPSRSNFRTAFKYLSPGYRAMLMDKSFVAKLEGK